MKPIEMPRIVYLRGEEAIEALSTFVNELEKQRGKRLTDNQTDALMRVANKLITSIEVQIQTNTALERKYSNSSYHFGRIISSLARFIG